MQTTAHEIAGRLNEYEATHEFLDYNIWEDVIHSLPEYDEKATAKADPGYWGGVAVLTDGTRIEKRKGEWVIVNTTTARERESRMAEAWEKARLVAPVLGAREMREDAEVRLYERIREAAAEGVSERDLAEASGISRTKVRRIIGREKP